MSGRLIWTGTVTTALAALAAFAVGCSSSKTTMAGPPTAFGVDITVDAKALSPAQLAAVTLGTLEVSGAEPQVQRFNVVPAIATGQLTFRYVPVVKSGMLSFQFDATGGTGVIYGTGTAGPVTLAAGAESVTITLKAAAAGATVKTNGVTCTTAAECASGFCTDGVCCQEACQEICASCALSGTTGLCVGYTAGTDPQKECGGFTGSADGGTNTDKGAADAGVSDGGNPDAEMINSPDGGIVATPGKCGGTCNGMKACAFAMVGTTCGDPFCNTRRDVASLVCDGNGSCGVSLASCTAGYACDTTTSACRTTCSANLDCQATSYCNGNTSMCAPTKADGITCATAAECTSGHCSDGVCCNTACDSPNTCNPTGGTPGKCQCPNVSCAAGVACQIFYADNDVDGFGNKTGTIAAGTAKAGCAGSPPAGFVADDTDCDDGDANVFPGQTAYFATVSKGTGTFDYNCDGTLEKGLGEYPGGSCTYCPGCSAGCSSGSSSTCASANTQASLACPLEGGICITTIQPIETENATAFMSIAATTISPPIIERTACCGCNDHAGFTASTDCGVSASYVTCGTCTAVGGGATSTSATKQQTCH